MGFVDKAKGLLLNPTKTFQGSKGDSLGDALKYAAVWFVILGVLAGIVFAAVIGTLASMYEQLPGLGQFVDTLSGWGYALVPVVIVMTVIGGIIGLIIGGAWTHLWVYVCGGRKGYGQTVKALAYGGTPGYVLGWIPFINFIGSLWALILSILGLRELHEISTGRAVAAVLLAVLIPGILYAAIIASTGSATLSS